MQRVSIIVSILLVGVLFSCEKKYRPVEFSVIGDVPYSVGAEELLADRIERFNQETKSSFLFHVGDIKAGKTPCDENIYINVANLLKKSQTPVYIIPGDNEYNDCENPVEALDFWKKHFLHFNKNWTVPWKTVYQEELEENLAWQQGVVLFLGLHLVGGLYHDSIEWEHRLDANVDWIKTQLESRKQKIEAMVVFGHANLDMKIEAFRTFTEGFRALAAGFNKPVLYIHGDGHAWIHDRPWPEKNIQRIQVDAGAVMLDVKVNLELEDPFEFMRE